MSENQLTFIDLVLSGNVLLEEIDDFVDQWHASNTKMNLTEFLGMHPDEYALWVEDESNLSYIVAARRDGVPITEYNIPQDEFKLAARAEKSSKVRDIKRWLETRRNPNVG